MEYLFGKAENPKSLKLSELLPYISNKRKRELKYADLPLPKEYDQKLRQLTMLILRDDDKKAKSLLSAIYSVATHEARHAAGGTSAIPKGKTNIKSMSNKNLAAIYLRLHKSMNIAVKNKGMTGLSGAFQFWKILEKKRDEAWKEYEAELGLDPVKNAAELGYLASAFYLKFNFFVFNQLLDRAIREEVPHGTRSYNLKVEKIKMLLALMIMLSIAVYGRKHIFRFARTQFKNIFEKWGKFQKKKGIHDVLEDIEMEASSTYSKPNTGSASVKKPKKNSSKAPAPKAPWFTIQIVPPQLK